MIDSPKPRRRWWRTAAWLMCSISALLLLTLAGAAWWLWGWQWRSELTFHESWSAEERAALTEFNNYLHDRYVTDVAEYVKQEFHDEEGLNHDIARACMTRANCVPVCQQLAHIAESGNANQPTFEFMQKYGCTPVIIASITAHFDAMKALIEHGANPNACLTHEPVPPNGQAADDDQISTPISDILSGYSFTKTRKPSRDERREAAEYLVSKGVDLNVHGYLVGINCTLALLSGETEPWFWALEHGKKVTGKELIMSLMTLKEFSLPLFEAMLRSTPGVANATDDNETPLQALAKRISYADEEEMPELEQVLDLLLAYGANPKLRPQPKDKYDSCESRLPLDILLDKRNFATCGMDGADCEGEGDDARTIWRRMCNKLQQKSL